MLPGHVLVLSNKLGDSGENSADTDTLDQDELLFGTKSYQFRHLSLVYCNTVCEEIPWV